MIVTEDNRSAEKSADFQEKCFTIKASPKAFQILSGSLYSNKPRAIIRELICNAYDAHIEKYGVDRGKLVEIQVHLPNYIEPWLLIKDFGAGISHSFMMDGYTTAFHSTKNNTNDEIGGLGLGRLSVLSYTDSYSVASTTKEDDINIKRLYVVCVERGFPTITFAAESVTDEPTGFEVIAPIKNYDTFEYEAINFLSDIDVNIKLSGTTKSPRKSKTVIERKLWRAYELSSDYCNYNKNTVYAKMGIVKYPIENKYLGDLADKSLEIDFPIGFIEVTPSREALSYTKETVERIKKRIEDVKQEIILEIQSKINAAQNLWEARLIAHSISSGELNRFHNLIKEIRYNGAQVSEVININSRKVLVFEKGRRQNKYGNYPIRRNYNNTINCNKTILIVIDDSPKCRNLRIKKILDTYSRVYILTIDEYNLIEKELDGYDIKSLSGYPFDKIERGKGIKPKIDYGEVFVYNPETYSYIKSTTDYDVNSFACFAALNKRDYYRFKNIYANTKKNCMSLNVEVPKLYLIHSTKKNKFKNWQPIEEFNKILEKEVDKLANSAIFDEAPEEYLELASAVSSIYKEYAGNKDNKKQLLLKEIIEIDSIFSSLRVITREESLLFLSFNKNITKSDRLKTGIDNLLMKRPLLRVFIENSRDTKDYCEAIKEYIL